MPKPGFKSITVSDNIYNKYFQVYEKRKKDLELKGITSFSGYITSMMEEMMLKHEVLARHAPMIEKISVDNDRVVLKDSKLNRIVEVIIRNGELQCLLDERTDCIHVGFVYSIPEVYSSLSNKGIKSPSLNY